jgi:Na+-transporting NADH:ubiquinone oxidoreductase subunit NqrB
MIKKILVASLIIINLVLVFYYSGLGGVVGSAVAVFILFKIISKIEKEDELSALSWSLWIFLAIWAMTHDYFGITKLF